MAVPIRNPLCYLGAGREGDTWSCIPEEPAEVHLQFSWDLWDRGGRGRGGGPFGLPELSSHLLFTTAFLII